MSIIPWFLVLKKIFVHTLAKKKGSHTETMYI